MSSGELLRIGGPLVAETQRAHPSAYLHLVDAPAVDSSASADLHGIDRIEAWAARTHHARMQLGFVLSGAFTVAISSVLLVR